MKFQIRTTDWFKRRTPSPEPKPVSVVVNGCLLITSHKCEMIATYDNGIDYELTGWVSQNSITGKWTVAGHGPGKLVLCDIIEESEHATQ